MRRPYGAAETISVFGFWASLICKIRLMCRSDYLGVYGLRWPVATAGEKRRSHGQLLNIAQAMPAGTGAHPFMDGAVISTRQGASTSTTPTPAALVVNSRVTLAVVIWSTEPMLTLKLITWAWK